MWALDSMLMYEGIRAININLPGYITTLLYDKAYIWGCCNQKLLV